MMKDHGEGNADVLRVRAIQGDDGTWRFQVMLERPSLGWEDYANGWGVVTPLGGVLKFDPGAPFTRLLLPPPVNEEHVGVFRDAARLRNAIAWLAALKEGDERAQARER